MSFGTRLKRLRVAATNATIGIATLHPASTSGVDLYRTAGAVEINGRRTRLEFRVSAARRAEGELPQVLRVRDKGASRPPNRRSSRRGKGSE